MSDGDAGEGRTAFVAFCLLRRGERYCFWFVPCLLLLPSSRFDLFFCVVLFTVLLSTALLWLPFCCGYGFVMFAALFFGVCMGLLCLVFCCVYRSVV